MLNISWSIPRGIIYHRLRDNLWHLISAVFSRLNHVPLIEKFERQFAEYMNVAHCISFGYARSALYCTLQHLNYPAGTEVIMPPITIKAIYDVVLSFNLKPVFVDLSKDSLCFDLGQLEQSITANTRLILVTYLYGMVPDMSEMMEQAKRHNLFVIEDFSQCLNGSYDNKKIGSFGDVGIYSASSTKSFDTYGGGLLVCDNDDLCRQIKVRRSQLTLPSRRSLLKKILVNLIRNFATRRTVFHCLTFPLIRCLDRMSDTGANRFVGEREVTMIPALPPSWLIQYTSFQAKVALRLLPRVEQNDNARRCHVNEIKSKCRQLDYPGGTQLATNTYWQFVSYLAQPHSDRRQLQQSCVDVARTSLMFLPSLVHYPYSADLPVADYIYQHGHFIPAYPVLRDRDIERLALALNEIEYA